MTTVFLAPTFGAGYQGFTAGGLPLNAGLIYTYIAGGTTPQATYTTSAGNVQNANPIVLSADGRTPAEVWLAAASYRFDVKDSLGNLIQTYDSIQGITGIADLESTSSVSLGDALVGFKQSDANGALSGAVGRTVHQKLQEIVSVKDFGAAGNGVTDDTSAIQAAISAVHSGGGGVVYFPAGTYNHTGISLYDSVRLIGTGAGNCILKNTAASNSVTINSGSDIRNCDLQYMRITSSGTSLIGITASQWGNMDSLIGVQIDSHVTGGLKTSACYNLTIGTCRINNNTGYGANFTNGSNSLKCLGTMFVQNGADGAIVDSSVAVVFDEGCDFESNGNNQIRYKTGGNRGGGVYSSYFEGTQPASSGYAAVKVDASVADTISIKGNFWDCSNAASGNGQITFLDVATGNSRVFLEDLGFSSSSANQYATFVNFHSGAGYCRAKVALTTNPITNASSTSRVFFDDYNEIGVIAGSAGAQSFTGSSWVSFKPTASTDTKTEWDVSSGTFTPKDYGLYEFTFAVAMAVTSGDTVLCRIYDTAGMVEYNKMTFVCPTSATQSISGSFTAFVGPSQTMQLQLQPSSTRSSTASGVSENWLNIHREANS